MPMLAFYVGDCRKREGLNNRDNRAKLLARAGRASSDVTLLRAKRAGLAQTNGPHTDKEVVRQAGRRCYERLLACGGRIFEYQRTMLHAKVLLVDSHWVTVGSVNFDNRSFALNDELNISFRDPGVVAEFEKHFLADLEDAGELNLAAWRARPLHQRAREFASALVRREL